MKLTGKVHRYGANVDTDVIIPARYLNVHEDAELARHCLEDLDPEFVDKVQPGDIIVAESNFGCGSSREHAPRCIRAAGVSCIIAASFARIFYRNSINIGLPILESPDAVEGIAAGDTLEIDLQSGLIVNKTRDRSYQAKPYPEFMLEIMDAGGLIPYVRARVEAMES